MRALRPAISGVLAAIAITTTMDATGLSAFSALPLAPLLGVLEYIERLPRRSLGFVWGRARHYGLAVLFPVIVIGIIACVAALAGATDLSRTNWSHVALNVSIVTLSTLLVVIITEEGFFRGWLWASLERAGVSRTGVLIWTSIAFATWHVSAISLPTGFDVPAAQIPGFLVNAAVLGAIWGLMREVSGSVIVSSLSHGLWNGLDYVLFSFGTKVGALGIQNAAFYGPEVGWLGLGVNVVFLLVLWRMLRSARARESAFRNA
jgi:membrane protease YdiL (CAAX protease family)